MTQNKYIGSDFNEFLAEEGIKEEVEALAIKKLIVYELEQTMKQKGITKTKMSELLQTSRTQLDRLLDPNNSSITLLTLSRAASITGKKLHLTLNAA